MVERSSIIEEDKVEKSSALSSQQNAMHLFRTHNCSELNMNHVGSVVKLSGWIHRKRDHGQLLFLDLRDHYGITQLIFTEGSEFKDLISNLSNESVITVEGKVLQRIVNTKNSNISTGEIEVEVQSVEIESKAEALPLQVNGDQDAGEEIRLKYRYLDLRRDKVHKNIILRSQVINFFREEMLALGFNEFQTPILTSSSPEGARDFLVPSRLHPGKFYALPQAPQIFKQLIMISGFDKYFQIAPCFRDEDSRADRSPGEFYQLDIEMSFVTQEDIFKTIEPVLHKVFTTFSNKAVSDYPFPCITYDDAMLKYGSDKPDLRNPLIIQDVTDIFADTNFAVFLNGIKQGHVVRAIPAFQASIKPRGFFDSLNNKAISLGAKGLGYITFDEKGETKGLVAKFLNTDQLEILKKRLKLENGDTIFFICDEKKLASKLAGQIRAILGQELGLISNDKFELCWVTDYPLFELDDLTNKIEFNHNPFSMPQGGLKALEKANSMEELLSIKAYQYDIVCNGIELCSGAIRNHKLEVLYKACEIVGYDKEFVDAKFSSLTQAFKYGAPPHGGLAPGIDRIVMLLADESNIREVILFPMNQKAEDLMMKAPSKVEPKQLRELNINTNY